VSASVTFVGPVERVLFLRTVSAFRHLPPEVLAAIARHTEELFVPNGSQVITPAGASDRVLLVVEGGLGVAMTDGRRSVIGPGGTIGLLARLARTPCPVSAWTETDTLALEIDWTAHLDVCEEHFGVLLGYVKTIATELLSQGPAPSGAGQEGEGREDVPLPRHSSPEQGLDRIQRALWLGVTPTFRRANRDALFELAGHVTESRWADGEVLWNAGDASDHFVLITSGRVSEAGGGSGPPAAAPSLLGLEESLAGHRRSQEIRAVGPVRALRVGVEPFLDILEDHFDAALGIAAELAGRLLPLTGGVLPAGPTISGQAGEQTGAL
jgi:CRP-like cAMP-binding protein